MVGTEFVENLIKNDPELISPLYGKDLIAYGTGKVGRVVIPFLAKNENLRLHGVTNSNVPDGSKDVFLPTRLPLRSINDWAKLSPGSTILITAVNAFDRHEIIEACTKAGFSSILPIPEQIWFAIQQADDNLLAIEETNYFGGDGPLTSNPLIQLMCFANEVRDVHKETFSEFRGCHRGKTVAVTATGPTMKYYTPLEGVRHIGVNTAFQRKDLNLDYYFAFDYYGAPKWYEELKNYGFIKFFGQFPADRVRSDIQVPEYIIEENHGRRFFSEMDSRVIHLNIEYYPLMGCRSIVFPALHFSLYTRPKRILLIGCDCTFFNHYNDGHKTYEHSTYADQLFFESGSGSQTWLIGYKKLYMFAKRFYPDTEIISVNPVGLKGLFHDVYTESYLDEHPELDRSQCEVLNPADYV